MFTTTLLDEPPRETLFDFAGINAHLNATEINPRLANWIEENPNTFSTRQTTAGNTVIDFPFTRVDNASDKPQAGFVQLPKEMVHGKEDKLKSCFVLTATVAEIAIRRNHLNMARITCTHKGQVERPAFVVKEENRLPNKPVAFFRMKPGEPLHIITAKHLNGSDTKTAEIYRLHLSRDGMAIFMRTELVGSVIQNDHKREEWNIKGFQKAIKIAFQKLKCNNKDEQCTDPHFITGLRG